MDKFLDNFRKNKNRSLIISSVLLIVLFFMTNSYLSYMSVPEPTEVTYNEFLEMMEKPEYNILLNKSVEQINNKKYLFFLGKGISAVIASYGAKFFTNLHKISFLIDDIFHPFHFHSID